MSNDITKIWRYGKKRRLHRYNPMTKRLKEKKKQIKHLECCTGRTCTALVVLSKLLRERESITRFFRKGTTARSNTKRNLVSAERDKINLVDGENQPCCLSSNTLTTNIYIWRNLQRD